MSSITGPIVELETVRRYRELLREGHNRYDITFSYALVLAIICWVVERGRSKETGAQHDRARAFFERLQEMRLDFPPWSFICRPGWKVPRKLGERLRKHDVVWRTVGHEDCMADQFLIALRNGMAHGDGRQVFPWNNGDTLEGYGIYCKIKAQNAVRDDPVLWKGLVFLNRKDLLSLGYAAADLFCEEVAPVDPTRAGKALIESVRGKELVS